MTKTSHPPDRPKKSHRAPPPTNQTNPTNPQCEIYYIKINHVKLTYIAPFARNLFNHNFSYWYFYFLICNRIILEELRGHKDVPVILHKIDLLLLSGLVCTPRVGVLNVEFALKLRIYRSLKSLMSQMNPKEVFHITLYPVLLSYIAGHSL